MNTVIWSSGPFNPIPENPNSNLPVASLAADWLLGFVGKALGVEGVELVTDASGSQSWRRVQQRRQCLGRGGFTSSHFAHRQ